MTPTSVVASDGQYVDSDFSGVPVAIGGRQHRTTEVLQDDGTYGSSIPYLFWEDTKGVYHQHYVSGGQILHVSSEPLPIKSVIINMEMAGGTAPTAAKAEESSKSAAPAPEQGIKAKE